MRKAFFSTGESVCWCWCSAGSFAASTGVRAIGNAMLQFHRKLEIHGKLEVYVLKDNFEDYFFGGEEDSRTTQRRDVANLFIML